jgi:hypothetical protein
MFLQLRQISSIRRGLVETVLFWDVMQRRLVDCVWNVMANAQKPNFVFRRNGRVHLNRQGASVQSTTGSRGAGISGSNAGYTMFRGSVKSTGYPLHSPVSPSLPHRVPSHFKRSIVGYRPFEVVWRSHRRRSIKPAVFDRCIWDRYALTRRT